MPPTPSATILSFEQARHLVEKHAATLRPQGKELVELLDSPGQILAEPVLADRNFPPFPRATRDGYAVRAADLAKLPATLQVITEIKAGATADASLKIESGQAAAIMTGAPAPPGCDAVVMVEYTSRDGDQVSITKGVAAGDNIVPIASEAKRGDRLLSPGVRLNHATIAVAASVGRSRLLVYSKPRVAVLATGDELVDIDVPLASNQIRNSNTYSLAAQIQAAGGEPVLLPIAPDEPERLRELIADGFEADLLLLTGGVSMGKYDLVEAVLAHFQAEFFFTGAQIQPGRPVVFGRAPFEAGSPVRHKYFFGLPGNPVSTMVTFELFARPILEALAGMTPRKLVFLHAKLKSEIKTKPGLKRFLPALLSGEFEQAEVELLRWQGSGDIAATAKANCYIVIPPDLEQIATGEWVPILML
ncbi:MAG TPA: gephyrin-like molybdotransferase Glp [Terriglobales bacterium]|nr:gephyrin-like molybdotransferase Glp [Terriglobales bacterium]